MAIKTFLTTLVLFAVIGTIQSDCDNGRKIPEYVRVKRAKYYSSPPQRFYRRPPITYPTRGIFSNTPPPGYMDVEDGPPNYRSVKFSQGPPSESLGDDNINNLIKYLSKQDLNKIIEFAEKDKNRNSQNVKNKVEGYNEPQEENFTYQNKQEIYLGKKEFLNDPYVSNNNNIEYSNLFGKDTQPRIVNTNAFSNSIDFSAHLDPEESTQNGQLSFLNAHIRNEINEVPNLNNYNLYTDGKPINEEDLPKPVNLRDDADFDASFTNNVPTITKAESSSYKIESIGDVPLMDYNSKLHTVSSYHVPHYTVTTPKRNKPSTSSSLALSSKTPELELAPPKSAAKENSDAHLKAIKIWTHRSRGTAYTLHSDGTLSLEKPSRP